MEKIFKKKNIKIFNWILFSALLIIFEFGYCNGEFSASIIQHTEQHGFNFSLCRGIIYVIFGVVLYFINRSKVIDSVEESYKNKIKRVFTLVCIIVEVLVLVLYSYKFLIAKDIALIQYTVLTMILISAFWAVMNITNKYFTNIISIFLVGVIFCISVNVYHMFDEKRHFMSAYNISYLNFDFNNPVVDKQFMDELPFGTHYTLFGNYFGEKYQFEQGELPKGDAVVDSTPAGYNPIVYIPSSLGILFGRIFQGSVADVFLVGRLFNLITYIALLALTLKILPYKKNVFLLIMSLPLILCYSATYSVDGIGIGVISIFIAYCLKLLDNKDNITFKNLVILACIYSLVLVFKSMSYGFIGVLVFLLPIRKIFKEHYKKLIPLIIVFILANIVLFKLQPQIVLTDNRYENVDASKQLQNVLQNPQIIGGVMETHIRNTLLNWEWIKGCSLFYFLSTTIESLFIVMFIYYIYIAFKDDSKNFTWKQKTIFILAFGLIYGFISGIFYLACTPVGYIGVSGYQVRYMFPILSLLLIILSNKTVKQNKDDNFLIKITYTQIIFITASLIGSIFK